MTQLNPQLQIIAQPKAHRRDRYASELNEHGINIQRYMTAEKNPLNFKYPTVQIPEEYNDTTGNIYIRVACTIVPDDDIPSLCVHPYPISTDIPDVYKDSTNNALYFPITTANFRKYQKTLLIMRIKIPQKDFNLPIHILDSDQTHTSDVITKLSRADGLIKIYKLWKSQLIFSVARHIGGNVFQIFPDSSVLSQVITHTLGREKNKNIPKTVFQKNVYNISIICAPESGEWSGNDTVLMVLTKLDRKKTFSLYFDYEELDIKRIVPYRFVDRKTILFETPACLMAPTGKNRSVPIIILSDGEPVGKFNFVYLAPSMPFSTNECLSPSSPSYSIVVQSSIGHKRIYPDSDDSSMDQTIYLD